MKPPSKLPYLLESVAKAMVFGVNRNITVKGKTIPAGTPLDMRTAARAVGVRVGSVVSMSLELRAAFAEALEAQSGARRLFQDPANLATAIRIRDDEDDGSNDTKRARLQAIESIRARYADPVPLELLRRKRLGTAPPRPIRRPGVMVRARPF
jgi:hypothetical protein